MSKKSQKGIPRRTLLKGIASAAVGAQLTDLGFAGVAAAELGQRTPSEATKRDRKTMIGVPFEKHEMVRIGIIGVGLRGTSVLKLFLGVDNVQVTAICDIVKEKCNRAGKLIQDAGQPTPAVYAEGDHAFEQLCRRDDLDFIYIATPWEWHVPQALAAMRNGKHVGTEVPSAYTIEDCWSLVFASEQTRRHCMLMENVCYAEPQMMVMNMVRAGVFGDLVHGECAYNHDLRTVLFDNNEGLWRRHHHTLRDGNLYPTHGLGPVATYMDINRGDRFDHMVAMSSGHLGLEAFRKERLRADDPRAKEQYVCGDYNTSIIKTALGRTIMLQHNVTLPRPYDLINLIHGTKAIFRDFPARVYLDGQEGGEQYVPPDKYTEQYGARLWKDHGEAAKGRGGHGGVDYLMCYRLVQCLREGLQPDIDVYDAAAWSVPGPLSVQSVAKGSAPMQFPDFTAGQWGTRKSAEGRFAL
jgi:hypothetical protein